MENPAEKQETKDVLQVRTLNPAPPTHTAAEIVPVQCLKCDKNYCFPLDKDAFLAHLFLEHRLVIADESEVALLEEYMKYWREQLKDHDLEEYCTTMLLDQLPDGTPAKNEKYYLLSDLLPQDWELRKRLRAQRLEQALARHQFERTDRSFSKECLYCRDVLTGLRADYLEHLFRKHFLQLGKPENLVYVDELLAKVQHNLEQLVCLYCEKVFIDRVRLKEHMRKKAHKRINPNNPEYDRYFLVNYRQERPKQSVKKLHKPREKPREAPQPASAESAAAPQPEQQRSARKITEGSIDFERRFGSQSDDSDSDWSDWGGDQLPPLICLFCDEKANDLSLLQQHMLAAHALDFDAYMQPLNFYQKIKVVNFVRRQRCLLRCVECNVRCETAEALSAHLVAEQHCTLGTAAQWDKPDYFFPTYEDDGLLCVLDDSQNDDGVDESVVRVISENTLAQVNKDAERLSLENFKFL